MNRLKDKTLRVGVVGCGSVSNNVHIPVFLELKETEIVAVCDLNEGLASKIAERFGIHKSYGDFSDMLNAENLDLVDICTPPKTHSPLSIQAMNAGSHVLVEKPMAISIREADEMVAASRKNDVQLCVVHNYLFSPVVQEAKLLIGAGVIGELVDVETRVLAVMKGGLNTKEHWYHGLPGGILSEYTPHSVYLELEFLGIINSLHTITDRSSDLPWVNADHLKVLLKGENASGSFTVICNSPRASLSMDIYGTKKILHLDIYPNEYLIQYRSRRVNRKSLLFDSLMSAVRSLTCVKSILTMRPWGEMIKTHRFLIQRFNDSIRNNFEPPVSGEAGRETVIILEEIWKQIYQSRRTQSPCFGC